MQGELLPSDDPLLGRRESGPDTDELWQDYEIQRSFVVSREQVLAMGKDPDITVKYADEMFGFGNDAYMAGNGHFPSASLLRRCSEGGFQRLLLGWRKLSYRGLRLRIWTSKAETYRNLLDSPPTLYRHHSSVSHVPCRCFYDDYDLASDPRATILGFLY